MPPIKISIISLWGIFFFKLGVGRLSIKWQMVNILGHIICWKSVKSLSHVRLCDPVECSLPASSVHGILQGRISAWVAICFSRGSSWPRDSFCVSYIVSGFFTIWANREAPYGLWQLLKFAIIAWKQSENTWMNGCVLCSNKTSCLGAVVC